MVNKRKRKHKERKREERAGTRGRKGWNKRGKQKLKGKRG